MTEKTPIWIKEEVVIAIHQRQISEHGGLDEIRDKGLLLSALAKAQNLYEYQSPPPDFAAIAAAYAYGIIKNHAFIDDNKRVAFVVCRLFLQLNGFDINASREEKYLTFLRLAEGKINESELASWIREKIFALAF